MTKTIDLTSDEVALLEGDGGSASALAMRLVVEMAGLLGADRLVPITSAHIDGCLYHGDSGVEFAERLVREGGRVAVPTTLNVGALDLLHPTVVRGPPHRSMMARRLMAAYQELGCQPTWTCAPYQSGHRPALGQHVAWGESNAVVFANSVLGARTERYGDFLDICCALAGRAPLVGLHLDRNRRATVVVELGDLSEELRATAAFYPVLGTWLGKVVDDRVAVIDGVPPGTSEDALKALGAAAASSGAVGLFHIAGVTPEAPHVDAALGGRPAERVIRLDAGTVRRVRDHLSTVHSDRIDAVALGSPHFSIEEFDELCRLAEGLRFGIPFFVCTGRGVLAQLEADGRARGLAESGVTIVVDTCVVVAPILAERGGVLMTNSGKFAHYTPSNTGYDVIYGSLSDCVASAVTGAVTRDETLWS